MVQPEDVYKAIRFIHDNKPFDECHEFNAHDKGIGAAIIFLYKAEQEVKSVDISRNLGISSARMTVILKKLEHKNIITKSTSKSDSRAVIINLTENGRILASTLEQNMFNTVSKIIEEIGLEELYLTFEKINKVSKILQENKPKIMEVLND